MPPRRASAKKGPAPPPPPSPKPLDGCIVVASGTFPAGNSHAALQKKVADLGGSFEKTVTQRATHLIVSEADFDKNSAKVVAAKANTIHILSLDWLLDTESKDARQDEADYSFMSIPTTSSTAAKSSTKSSTKKRRIAVKADSDDDDQQNMKKLKGSNGTVGESNEAASEADAKPKDKEAKAEGQRVKSLTTVVPVDERFTGNGYVVYIDPDNIVYDAALNQSHASNNNNKFYKVQIVVNLTSGRYHTWTRWGRVGENGQSSLLGNGTLDDAMQHFYSKFKAKSGLAWEDRLEFPKHGKYVFVEKSYESDDESMADANGSQADPYIPPKSTLEKPVQDLMRLIFNQQFFANTFESLNYDANKLPLGKLSKMTITRGFQDLKNLNDVLDDPSSPQNYDMSNADAIEHYSNAYYSIIPHSFGRNRPPIINSLLRLKTEIGLLESLSDMKAAEDIMKIKDMPDDPIHPLDRQFNGLGLEEMSVVDPKSQEYNLIEKYLQESKGRTHSLNYRLDHVFRIERQGEKARFKDSKFSGIPSEKRLLWHGSRCTNFGGILSQGLRIAPPEAPVSGYMFGKGIYLADMSTKSANYCCHYGSAGNALLLLCEAELGDPMQELLNANYHADEMAAKYGKVSTWGQGRIGPKKWQDARCIHPSLEGVKMPDTSVTPGDTGVIGATLQYNEYICYDVAQVQLRYLLRVTMT